MSIYEYINIYIYKNQYIYIYMLATGFPVGNRWMSPLISLRTSGAAQENNFEFLPVSENAFSSNSNVVP